MHVPPGTRIDRYEVERPLGSGGMGQIYLARDTKLERPVAVKLLSRTLVGDAHLVGRFRREARALLSLNHPHLLTVFDVGEIGGTPYFVTELVEGTTLRELMDHHDLPLREVLRIVSQAAAALAAAHAKGIVHRDVKPENVMVRHDGYVKVLDFGVAKLLDRAAAADESRNATVATAMVGTVRYMSPEQLRGDEVDARTDVWGLAVVLYELLTDSLPFPGRTPPDVIAAILRLPPLPPSEVAPGRVPPALDAIIARALAKDRGARQTGCEELAAELDALQVVLRARESGPGRVREARSLRGDSDPTSAWREISAALHEADAEAAPRHNLPVQPTSFLGRESELAAVVAALRRPDVRLLVLTGPGGAGKTRLSLEAAALLIRDYPDGVWQVPLAAVNDPAAVPEAIGAVLGVKELGDGTPLESLVRWVRGRRLLLLLDNFEQVAGAAPVLSALLAGAPGVELLVTSREVLRVRGEYDFPVPPLELPAEPPAGQPQAPGALAEVPAVALFVSRAAALDPRFTLHEGNAAAVAELCRRLDGLPLAIELAAARVRVLSPQAMLRRLDDRFRLLGGGPADLPDRHRTLRGTLDWGHELLDARERRLFRRLGVFRGSFGLAAVEAVCADGPEQAAEALDLVASLVDKSLLQRLQPLEGRAHGEALEGEPRFALLETIREYARGLLEPEEREALRRRHAAWHLDLARRAAPDAPAGAATVPMAELAVAHDDLRAALEWAAEQDDPEALLRLTATLWWFWYLHGDYGEGRRWTAQALARVVAPEGAGEGDAGAGAPARAQTLLGAGVLAMLQCDYSQAEELLAGARQLAEALGARPIVAAALQWSGSVARERGRYERALALHGASLELWRELGDERGVARSLNFLAFASWLNGDTVEAARLAEETEPLFRPRDDHEGLVWSLLNRTAVACHTGDLARARALGRETLAVAGSSQYREGEAWSLELLGTVALREGRPERAEGLLRRSLELHRELGDRWRMASVLEGLAAVARAGGALERAVRLDAAAARLREAIGTPVPPVEAAGREEERAAVRLALGAERHEEYEREGREMSTERAYAYAVAREGTGGSSGG